jgi:uncharacterized integral membrane protein (TIGR00698 family)
MESSAISRPLPGVALCLAVAATATALASVAGLGSGPVIGLGLGLVVGTLLGPRRSTRSGVRWSVSVPLRAAVVVLGAELPLGAVLSQGARSLPGIVVTLGGCLVIARLLGRRLGIPARLRTLVGVGTAICGASAIAAVTPVIDAEETEVGYSVATIFLFNVLAVLLFPLLGHALGLGQRSFGVFAGTAVNDLSSVVATAGIYGAGALHTAVIVKLTRTLMIVPVCIVLGRARRPATDGVRDGAASVAGFVPPFLLGFAALAALRGAGAIPSAWAGGISETATLLITVALSAVGLSIDLGALQRAGARPLVLGAALWVTVSALSLGCQAVGLL